MFSTQNMKISKLPCQNIVKECDDNKYLRASDVQSKYFNLLSINLVPFPPPPIPKSWLRH